jgi:hypothetical protein
MDNLFSDVEDLGDAFLKPVNLRQQKLPTIDH